MFIFSTNEPMLEKNAYGIAVIDFLKELFEHLSFVCKQFMISGEEKGMCFALIRF